MNILVTGHTGFLGNALIGKLKSKDNLIIGVERDKREPRAGLNIPDVQIRGDVRDCNLMRRVIADYNIEAVYHCAAQAIVKTCADDPYTTYDVNVMGTVSLLEACRNSGGYVKSIVVSTSDKAFGHAPVPYTEKTPLNPLYTYETSKACQQLITLSYFHNYGLPTKVVACSNIYGPGDPNMSRVIPRTITRLYLGQPAILYEGAGDHIREYVFVDDVVDAFMLVTKKGNPGEAYCCGGTEHLSTSDLIKMICQAMGKDAKRYISSVKKQESFKEIGEQYIDSSKLKALGWKPKVKLDEGLSQCIDYYTNLAAKGGVSLFSGA